MPTPTRRAAAFAAPLALAALSACAQAPERIAAAPVGDAQYIGFDCRRLVAEETRLAPLLAHLETEQRQSRSDDAWGMWTLLRPFASMASGDLSHQIALRRGEQRAVRGLLSRDCAGHRAAGRVAFRS